MKKIFAILVVLSLLTAYFTACSSKDRDDNSNVTPQETNFSSENADEESSDKTNVPDDLPDMDFGGYNFRIYLASEDDTPQVWAENDIGEVVNDAVYYANRTVEERFNVKLTPMFFGGDHNKIRTTIMAGEDAFDVVSGHDITMGTLSLDNIFLNLYNIPHLNFEKPWWPKNTVESLTLMKDKMYLFSNHMSYWWLDATRVMFFNKNKFTDLGYELPYQSVFNGTWTFDKFFEMTKDVYVDQNGNGERDESDFYGFVKSDGEFYCYLESWGVQVVTKDEDEILKTNEKLPEIMPNILNKLYDLLFTVSGGYQTRNDYGLPNSMFAAGNSLFLFKELFNARNMVRDANFDFGILPMPKMEGQKDYIAGCTDRPYAVPTTARNLERIGVIIEAMSAEGYKQVLPAYYEIALKVKYTHDDESVRALDIITESVVLDFWYIYGANDSNMIWSLATLMSNKNPSTDFASYYEKMESRQQARINKVIEAIESMD